MLRLGSACAVALCLLGGGISPAAIAMRRLGSCAVATQVEGGDWRAIAPCLQGSFDSTTGTCHGSF